MTEDYANDDIRPMSPMPVNDELQALIMGGRLGCHGAISQSAPAPAVAPAALPALPALPALFSVAPKRPLPFPVAFPVAPEPLQKQVKVENLKQLWKHAGLLREFGGIQSFMRMQRGEVAWPAGGTNDTEYR